MDSEFIDQIEQLYIQLYDKLIVYALSSLDRPELAEEAVQETFRIACQKPQSVCDSPNPPGWIFNTLKYTICNIKSSQASAKKILEQYILTQVNDVSVSEDRIRIDVLYENVADSDEFQIIKEMAIEKRSHEEMAAKRGITVSACKKRVQRAKDKLRQKLKDCL